MWWAESDHNSKGGTSYHQRRMVIFFSEQKLLSGEFSSWSSYRWYFSPFVFSCTKYLKWAYRSRKARTGRLSVFWFLSAAFSNKTCFSYILNSFHILPPVAIMFVITDRVLVFSVFSVFITLPHKHDKTVTIFCQGFHSHTLVIFSAFFHSHTPQKISSSVLCFFFRVLVLSSCSGTQEPIEKTKQYRITTKQKAPKQRLHY